MSQSNAVNESSIKICVLGEESVGKSCLINRFVNKSFAARRINHDKMEELYDKQMKINNDEKTYNIQIIDTTNSIHNKEDNNNNYNDMIHIELKDVEEDNHDSMDIRKSWIMNNDILFLLFNRLNRNSWLTIQNIHALSIKYLSNNIQYIPIYIISTCSDLYKSSNNQSQIDLVVKSHIAYSQREREKERK